jgi:polysaccharide biosynthesis protein PslH
MEQPRVLSVVWYRVLPARFGGQKGIAEFNAFLSEQIPLTCVCSSDNDPACATYPVLNDLPIGKWQVINPLNWWRILSVSRKTGATHLIIEHCYYAIAGMLAKQLLGIHWILHEHNIEYLRFREMHRWWWPLLKWLESWSCRNASLVLFKTESDRQYAIRHFGMKAERSMIVPFGISVDGRPSREEKSQASVAIRLELGLSENTHILFFSGTLDYEPNARAFRRLVEEIIPLLDSRLMEPFTVIVCGRLREPAFEHLRSLSHPRLIFLGEVDEVRPYFLAADVFINPVDTGGGIKVKTMEALSYDLPVVSTEHSASGIDQSLTGTKLRVSPDGDLRDFCQQVSASLNDQTHIPDAYFVHYQWRHLTHQVAEAIKKLRN